MGVSSEDADGYRQDGDGLHFREAGPRLPPLRDGPDTLHSTPNKRFHLLGNACKKQSITIHQAKQTNCQLDVKIQGVTVPTVKNPKLLGVTLDPLFTFSAHAMSVVRRASSRLNLMRTLSDTSFGKDKECLMLTFRCFIRSIFSYAAPIVFPSYSKASIEKLQRVQSKALCLALGCHKASSLDHLHAEAEEIPVGEHLRLLSSQYIAQALQPHHISQRHAIKEQGRRNKKHT